MRQAKTEWNTTKKHLPKILKEDYYIIRCNPFWRRYYTRVIFMQDILFCQLPKTEWNTTKKHLPKILKEDYYIIRCNPFWRRYYTRVIFMQDILFCQLHMHKYSAATWLENKKAGFKRLFSKAYSNRFSEEKIHKKLLPDNICHFYLPDLCNCTHLKKAFMPT